MSIVNEMDNTEIPLKVFFAASQKSGGCSHLVTFMGQKTCKLYNYKLDSNMDTLSYCANCVANKKKPTNKLNVRGP
ncbi:hypothetical protein HN789_06825 [archaeon]|jgi:hypothetical protein|nr:hypothetical protein [archaeon]MBT4022721.1 hypothetical protein [archaeon]MBT4273085.1 hypothetical protein [archaeon]MBT4461066.1 hypothetical protein [archaeon]MBT4858735.1 hypothetical protein [archaeon]